MSDKMNGAIDQDEFLSEAKEFFELNKDVVKRGIDNQSKVVQVDFDDFSAHSPELAGNLIDRPEETVQLLEVALEELEWAPNDARVRFSSISKGQEMFIRHIRSRHLGKMIGMEGIVRQASEVRPLVTNAKFECPSCLPKGTLIHTPKGLIEIENIKSVFSVNENFKLTEKPAKVIKTGRKKVFKINRDIEASPEHRWFVYKNGTTQVIQTKDLNVGDIFYRLYGERLCDLWTENSSKIFMGQKKNLQLGLQEKISESCSGYGGESEIRQPKDNRIIQGREIDCQNCRDDEDLSQVDKEETAETWDKNEDSERAVCDKCKRFEYLQAWKEMWRKRISEVSEGELSDDLHDMRKGTRYDEGIVGSSQRWESLQQQIRELDDSLQFVPCEVTQIDETGKEVEMYDLQVPDTNNFILSNGIITHNCGTIISVLQIDKKFKEPSRCSCGRRGGFKEIAKDMVDAQVLTIEEASDNLHGGEQPKRMTIFLKEDLVDPNMEMRTTPGSRVKVIGILKEIAITTGSGAMLTRFDLAVEANNLIPLDESFEDIDIDEEDERTIRELAADPKMVEKMVDSIAPSIWGHRDVKKALAFQLFGGVRKTRSDGTKMRGDIHVLLVGDPGVAKSVMLGFIAGVAPKARYVSGKSASAAGLTAAVVKDDILKGWGLEAGAIVLANKGIVCIDEFDKMDEEDRSAMHEAMEQQTITISKATVQATLRAQTSVLAAANPKFGRFDPLQSIPKQVNLVPSLLSRFDAIFIIRDIPSRENDEAIASHVLLEHKQEAHHDVIDKDLLKKYISYAKQKYNPKLTDGAIEAMKEFYVSLRNMPQMGDGPSKPIPIGARQLEAMVRLAEAHARMRLSDEVEVKDAIAAIDLTKGYLMQVGYDKDTKTFDVDRITGTGASARNKIHYVQEAIEELEKKVGKLIPLEEVTKVLEGKVSEAEVDEVVGKLLKAGDLFRPKRGFVQRM